MRSKAHIGNHVDWTGRSVRRTGKVSSGWLTLHRVLILVAVISVVLPKVAGAEGFRWPFDMDVALSSTFGESRSRSFHAGVDLKTWGKVGYEVKAVADGHVWRLRTSPWGFGRAVYQKLGDGRIVVYAHLKDFAPPLAARVKGEQEKKGAYSVDVWLAEQEIPVRRGELLAWSGDSGTGPPHLHLELRDADNIPLNPLLHGFEIEDSMPPTLRRIGFTPIGMESAIEGGHAPASFGVAFAPATGSYQSGKVVSGYGRIGVSVLAHDRGDVAPNKLAPYRFRLFVDGQETFSTTYTQVNAYGGDGHHVFLDRSRIGDAGRFNNLFILPGNRLDFYETASGDGLLGWGVDDAAIRLSKGLHELQVQVEDVAGNVSRGSIRVNVNAEPALGPLQLLQDGEEVWVNAQIGDADDAELQLDLSRSVDGSAWATVEKRMVKAPSEVTIRVPAKGPALWRLRAKDEFGGEAVSTATLPDPAFPKTEIGMEVGRVYYPEFVDLALRFDQLLRSQPRVVVQDGDRRESLPVRQTGLAQYRVMVPLRPDGAKQLDVAVHVRARGGNISSDAIGLSQQSVGPWSDRMVHFQSGRVTLVVPGGSAFTPLFPQVDPVEVEAGEGLTACDVGYAFSPDGTTFDRNVAVVLQYPEESDLPVERLGVYHRSNGGKWALVGNDLNPEQRTVSAWVRRFSQFALMADLVPPEVRAVEPTNGSLAKGRRPLLRARVGDKGSGLGREEDVSIELDGENVICEFDPEAESLTHRPGRDLKPGKHTLVVRLRDRAGNETTAESEFSVE